jgi:hypothetical protein
MRCRQLVYLGGGVTLEGKELDEPRAVGGVTNRHLLESSRPCDGYSSLS